MSELSMIARTIRTVLLGLTFALPTLASAQASQAELRLWVARLIETLDAGLTRVDLRSLRIEIGAQIRVIRLGAPTAGYELDELNRAIVATDQAWQLLQGLPACQPAAAGGPVAQPPACLAQLRPNLMVLGVDSSEWGSAFTQAAVVQPILVALRRQAERSLRSLR
jgi:hypothetical protein